MLTVALQRAEVVALPVGTGVAAQLVALDHAIPLANAALAEASAYGPTVLQVVNHLHAQQLFEIPVIVRQAQELVAADVDLLVAIGTPALQAAIAVAPSPLPVVFCYCANPWGAGAGRSAPPAAPSSTGFADADDDIPF